LALFKRLVVDILDAEFVMGGDEAGAIADSGKLVFSLPKNWWK
jgi:hypothetical protein